MQHIKIYNGAGHARPHYPHDCEHCTFVGRFNDDEENIRDLYRCVMPDGEGELVIRFGPHGSEYSSFKESIARLIADQGSAESYEWVRAVRLLDEVTASDNGHHLVPDLSRVKISVHHGAHVNDDGEGGYSLIFVTHDDVPQDLLNDYVRERHPATHCQHSYDCCGNAYSGSAWCKLHTPVMAIYEQHWHLNI